MSKKSKAIFLPRNAKAYWTYTATKLIMILVFFIYMIFISVLTYHIMKYFKDKIEDLNEKNPYGNFMSTSDTINYIISGRQAQKLQTHRHFFLFTALFLLGSSALALYGAIKEMISLLIGFILMQLLSIAFEYVGALKSKDEQVLNFKYVSLFVQILLIILTAIYAIMIQRMEHKLASERTYRQTIISVMPKTDNQEKAFYPNQFSNETTHSNKQSPSGNVNLAINLEDE